MRASAASSSNGLFIIIILHFNGFYFLRVLLLNDVFQRRKFRTVCYSVVIHVNRSGIFDFNIVCLVHLKSFINGFKMRK